MANGAESVAARSALCTSRTCRPLGKEVCQLEGFTCDVNPTSPSAEVQAYAE